MCVCVCVCVCACVCAMYLVEHSFVLLAEFGEARGGGSGWQQGWDGGGGAEKLITH